MYSCDRRAVHDLQWTPNPIPAVVKAKWNFAHLVVTSHSRSAGALHSLKASLYRGNASLSCEASSCITAAEFSLGGLDADTCTVTKEREYPENHLSTSSRFPKIITKDPS
jgi:hypothetical protein